MIKVKLLPMQFYDCISVDNVTFRNKKEKKASRFFKVIEVEDA